MPVLTVSSDEKNWARPKSQIALSFNAWAVGAVVSVCNGTGLPLTWTSVVSNAEYSSSVASIFPALQVRTSPDTRRKTVAGKLRSSWNLPIFRLTAIKGAPRPESRLRVDRPRTMNSSAE